MKSKNIEYVEITPKALQCPPPACPAIFRASDGTLLIIGRVVSSNSLPPEIRSKIGNDEQAVAVPQGFLDAKAE